MDAIKLPVDVPAVSESVCVFFKMITSRQYNAAETQEVDCMKIEQYLCCDRLNFSTLWTPDENDVHTRKYTCPVDKIRKLGFETFDDLSTQCALDTAAVE
jgi:hypothetical protein